MIKSDWSEPVVLTGDYYWMHITVSAFVSVLLEYLPVCGMPILVTASVPLCPLLTRN